jgi:hypothetical protein
MYSAKLLPIEQIKTNPKNPRVIRDGKFQKLKKSIQDFPEMLNLRPLIVNDDMIVIGGNMRLKALQELGYKEVPIIMANDLSEDQQNEFIIKDNLPYGEWDYDMLGNEWDHAKLIEWGMEIPKFDDVDIDEFFKDDGSSEATKDKIVLIFPIDEIDSIRAGLLKHGETYEDAIINLLK